MSQSVVISNRNLHLGASTSGHTVMKVGEAEKRVSTSPTTEAGEIFSDFKCKYRSNDGKVVIYSGAKKIQREYYQASLPELSTSHKKIRSDFPPHALVARTSIPTPRYLGWSGVNTGY